MPEESAVREEGRWSLRCALGLHPWLKWGPVEMVHVSVKEIVKTPDIMRGVSWTSSEPMVYDEFRQTRRCGACGLTEWREVRAQHG